MTGYIYNTKSSFMVLYERIISLSFWKKIVSRVLNFEQNPKHTAKFGRRGDKKVNTMWSCVVRAWHT